MYYKNQLFYIIISCIFFGLSLFFYVQNLVMADQFEKATLPVKDKNCSHAPRMGSSLIVSKDGKDYTVSLPSDDCFDIEVGKQVQLLYNNNLDYFVVPGHNKVYTIRLISSSLVLFLCCIPWRFLRRKY